MSIWNQILQAAHSALIDELSVRFPTEKFELGLPKRFDGFAALDENAQILFQEILSAAEGTGFAALSGTQDQPIDELIDVFSKTRMRTEKEFKIRGINAEFGSAIENSPKTRMTIWLPIAIRRPKETRAFDLALGIGA